MLLPLLKHKDKATSIPISVSSTVESFTAWLLGMCMHTDDPAWMCVMYKYNCLWWLWSLWDSEWNILLCSRITVFMSASRNHNFTYIRLFFWQAIAYFKPKVWYYKKKTAFVLKIQRVWRWSRLDLTSACKCPLHTTSHSQNCCFFNGFCEHVAFLLMPCVYQEERLMMGGCWSVNQLRHRTRRKVWMWAWPRVLLGNK